MNYDQAFRRIDRLMLAFGVGGTVFVGLERGWRDALAFAFGAAISAVNFRWLKSGVDVLAAKFAATLPPVAPPSADAQPATTADPPPPVAPAPRAPRFVAVKFIARYALLGLAGYVIFTGLRVSVPVFLAGLFVSVAAIMAEMIYQLAMGTRNA